LAFVARPATSHANIYVVRSGGGVPRLIARNVGVEGMHGSPSWSPDGRRLAYSRGGPARSWLALASSKGRGQEIPLTRSAARLDVQPDWSPDGQSIVFARFRTRPGSTPTVHAIHVKSRRLRLVSGGGSLPTWSPNGRLIAFRSKHSLFVAPARGLSRRLVARHGERVSALEWSPDSRRLAFADRNEVFVVDVARAQKRRLTSLGRKSVLAAGPSWSGSGRLVYASARRLESDLELHFIRGDGSGARALTANSFHDAQPDWSPDGRQVAFTHGGRIGGVYVIGADGRGLRLVLHGAHSPSWAPDGKRLALVLRDDIWIATLGPEPPIQLTSGPEKEAEPDWSPRGDEVAFGRGGQVHAISVGSASVRQVTHVEPRVENCVGGRAAAGPSAWSPDGAWLAYEVLTACSLKGRTAIHVIRTDGTGDRVVVTGFAGVNDEGTFAPAWTPDGREIVFEVQYEDPRPEYPKRRRLASKPVSGGDVRLITPASYHAYSPSVRPAG
jgi:Tol biopolymer transport system component